MGLKGVPSGRMGENGQLNEHSAHVSRRWTIKPLMFAANRLIVAR